MSKATRKRLALPASAASSGPELFVMSIVKKLKLRLDETRMLILGAQILIGFQFRSVFEPAFDRVPAWWRHIDGIALLLMVAALCLLILPGPYHRIVEGGECSEELLDLAGRVASMALAPFAVSLGLDVGLAGERVWGVTGGLLAGLCATALAIFFWYGLARARKRSVGHAERAMNRSEKQEVEQPSLHEKIDQMLTEARVILPGAQALFGFQLAIVLTDSFEKLSPGLKSMHGLALGFVCLSVILLMAPAAYHRIVYGGEESEQFYRIGAVLVTCSTIPLALGLAADVFVVATRIVASTALAAALAGAALIFLIGCWHVLPLAARHMARSQKATRRLAK
jgi:hypothetical protein